MPEVTIDTSQLRDFGRMLHRVAPELEKEFPAALATAGEVVAVEARHNAESFSRRIPGTIKTRRRGNSVRVVAGGPDAPHAGLFEFGSRGNPSTIRHPLFGDFDVWYSQPTHPFLAPALESKVDDVVAGVLGAVDVTLARLAF